MRPFYYLFLYLLITCFQYTFTCGKSFFFGGGLAPQPLMNAAYAHKPTLLNPIAFGFKKTDELLLPVKCVKPIPEDTQSSAIARNAAMADVPVAKLDFPALDTTLQN